MNPDPAAAAVLQMTDESVMAQVLLGNSLAFTELVTRYHRRGYQLSWRILHNQADAEDVVQEQFIKIWRGAARFDPERGTFWGWFARLVTNGCIDRNRSLKLLAPMDDAVDAVDETPSADRLAEGADTRRALDALPPRQRAVIALFYLEGFSMTEIAVTLSITSKAVEALLARGRSALKLELCGPQQALCA